MRTGPSGKTPPPVPEEAEETMKDTPFEAPVASSSPIEHSPRQHVETPSKTPLRAKALRGLVNFAHTWFSTVVLSQPVISYTYIVAQRAAL